MVSFTHPKRTFFNLLSPDIVNYTYIECFYFYTANCLGIPQFVRSSCLRIKDDCLYPRSSTSVRCYTVCISRMPIGTPGKFVGTRGRRGSRLCGGHGGVFRKGGALMIYGNVTDRYIERRPGWHCQGAHRVLSPSYSLRGASFPSTPYISA